LKNRFAELPVIRTANNILAPASRERIKNLRSFAQH